MTLTLDVAATVAAVATVITAVGGILAARWAHQAKTAANQAARQTNGPLTKIGDEVASSALTGALILDGIGSLGHQIGEVRDDMGRLADRLTALEQKKRK